MEDTPPEMQVEEIESLCMNCHEDGTTRLLLTRIPFFREIVIMSFECPHCGFKNSEIQSAGEIQQRGVKFSFKLDEKADLERQIIKGDTCVCRVVEIELEIPAGRGQLTNIEGLLSTVKQDLEAKQPQRKEVAEELYIQIQAIIEKLFAMTRGQHLPFTVILDDSTGNSSIEPSPSDKAGKYVRSDYARTAAQNNELGLVDGEQTLTQEAPATEIRPEYHTTQMYPQMRAGIGPSNADALADAFAGDNKDGDIVENEVYAFPASCPGCTKFCTTNMKMVQIPHFEQVIIMSTACDHCGYRSNEVKSGGKVPEKGRRITLNVINKEDLSRDILKAESCTLACPELSLNVEPGTLGGRFTTVEGLLTQVRNDLRSNVFGDGEVAGDSMAGGQRAKWKQFFAGLDSAINGDMPFTIMLEDPLAASYVQSFTAPEPDSQIISEEYERTEEEEEHLGLRDIKTEEYEKDVTTDMQTDIEQANQG